LILWLGYGRIEDSYILSLIYAGAEIRDNRNIMILGIDTTEREKIYLTIFGEKGEKCFEFDTKDQSKELLLIIDSVLKKEKKTLQNLRAILVNQGPGSFTGVRVGITCANALAWSLDIPVFGYQRGQEKLVLNKISKHKKNSFSQIALPYYPF